MRGTESETGEGEKDRSEVSVRQRDEEGREQVSIREQTRCGSVVVIGLAHPGEQGGPPAAHTGPRSVTS